jgi:hypothetical protein
MFVQSPLRPSKSDRRVAKLCLIIVVSSICSLSAAHAQIGIGCGIDSRTRATLESIKSAADDDSVAAARALIDNWQVNLPTLMNAIEAMRMTEASTWGPPERQQTTFVVGVVKTILASKNQAIPLFRQCDSGRTVKPLIWAARGDDTALRLNSANILANTVDDTTVCFVLHHLRDKDISDNGRANLLGITRAMASYAHKESVDAILETIEIVKRNLGNRLERLPQTQQLLADLRSRAERSSHRNTPAGAALGSCQNYDYGSPLSRTD